ncbi:MAG: integration host factor subunit alpha [Candidatus Pelagibacter sp.]|nr:integration host factor subunit alpha [Candidatus Pelagibacter sp.]|tara:strand:+ start:1350 stop:1649 length:300 start_codon:yes stop_codon:yes gene_type:complete
MEKNKKINLTKKNISKKIVLKTGFSHLYVNEILDDFINLLKDLIKENHLTIKNFGTFKTINKAERTGRNPKNNKIYKISARKSLSFISSKSLSKKMNDN